VASHYFLDNKFLAQEMMEWVVETNKDLMLLFFFILKRLFIELREAIHSLPWRSLGSTKLG